MLVPMLVGAIDKVLGYSIEVIDGGDSCWRECCEDCVVTPILLCTVSVVLCSSIKMKMTDKGIYKFQRQNRKKAYYLPVLKISSVITFVVPNGGHHERSCPI